MAAVIGRPVGDALVWVDKERVILAEPGPAGFRIEEQVLKGDEASELETLAGVARQVEDRDHVFVGGSADGRLAFEREYVSLSHRPDRLVDVDLGRRLSRARLLASLRAARKSGV